MAKMRYVIAGDVVDRVVVDGVEVTNTSSGPELLVGNDRVFGTSRC